MNTVTDPITADAVVGLYRSVAAGDPTAAMAYLTDDAVLHVPGTQPLAGDHIGPLAVVEFIAASAARADRTERVEVLDVLVGAGHAAAYCHVTGARDGRAVLDNRTVHLFRLVEGRIAEIWFHNWDQPAVDAFWS